MYFKSKKHFEEAVMKECDRRLGTQVIKRIIQLGVADLNKTEVEQILTKVKTQLKDELKLEDNSFIVVPVLGMCAGHIDVIYLS